MATTTPTVSFELANQVLWTFGQGGFPPGTFMGKVLDLIAYADRTNEAKLAAAFPAEVAAVQMAKYDHDGLDRLQAIAAKRDAA